MDGTPERTMNCPSCSKEIPEASPRCLACGWIRPVPANSQWSSTPPTWMWGLCGVLAAIGLGCLACVSVIVLVVGAGILSRCERDASENPRTRALTDALFRYAHEHEDRFPASLVELLEPGRNGEPFLRDRELLRDEWGNDLHSVISESEPVYAIRVLSLGADGVPGGTSADADREVASLTMKSRRTGR